MKRERVDKVLAQAFERLSEVPPPDKERQVEQRIAYMDQVHQYRRLVAPLGQPGRDRTRRFIPLRFLGSRRIAIAGAVVALVMVVIAGAGGVIYAADGSVPGDPLYGIDQTVESAQLRLTTRPEARMSLLLSLATERLLEAQELSARENDEDLEVALDGFGAVVSSLARALGTGEGGEETALATLLDESFSAHEEQMADPSQDADEVWGEKDRQGGQEQDKPDPCVGADPHPVAERLAASYHVPYESIMGWFCEGNYGLGEIMLALETSKESIESAEDLLAMKTELGGWGKVWQELGLIGRRGAAVAGPPAHAGPPDGVPVRPPDEAGPSDDAPVGALDEGDASGDELDSCVGADPHPVAEKLAQSYGVPYEDVMEWFCEGKYGFGEIKLALEASEETGKSAEDLLAMKTEMGGWGKVWQELGLIGRPDRLPGGPFKDKSTDPSKDKPGGPPEDKPGGPPEDKPGGRPKDKQDKPSKGKPGKGP